MPATRSSGSLTWTPMGSLRSPGDPFRVFAPLLDPGRTDVPLPWRSHRCCPRLLSQRRLRARPLLGRRGRPPRAAKAQARAAKTAVAAAVAAVDRAIAAAERCRQAEAQQEDADSTRQLAGPRQRAHAPADTCSGAEGTQTARPKLTRK